MANPLKWTDFVCREPDEPIPISNLTDEAKEKLRNLLNERALSEMGYRKMEKDKKEK